MNDGQDCRKDLLGERHLSSFISLSKPIIHPGAVPVMEHNVEIIVSNNDLRLVIKFSAGFSFLDEACNGCKCTHMRVSTK